MAFSATDCKAGLKTSSPLKRRVLQPAPAGRLKQRTAPPHPAPLRPHSAGPGLKASSTGRPSTPRQRNPGGRPGEEAAAGRGSHSPAGQRGLGSRQASRGQTPAAGNKCLRALRVEAIPGVSFLRGRTADGPREEIWGRGPALLAAPPSPLSL